MPRRRNKDLIILRGLPGVGKTYRANMILDEYRQYGKIGQSFTTDIYHEQTGYKDNAKHDNHRKNRRDVLNAMKNRVDPIIIDNINIELWEMWPYVRMGFRRGYWISIEVVPAGFPDRPCDIDELVWRCQGLISKGRFLAWEAKYQKADNIFKILYNKGCKNRWMGDLEFRSNRW